MSDDSHRPDGDGPPAEPPTPTEDSGAEDASIYLGDYTSGRPPREECTHPMDSDEEQAAASERASHALPFEEADGERELPIIKQTQRMSPEDHALAELTAESVERAKAPGDVVAELTADETQRMKARDVRRPALPFEPEPESAGRVAYDAAAAPLSSPDSDADPLATTGSMPAAVCSDPLPFGPTPAGGIGEGPTSSPPSGRAGQAAAPGSGPAGDDAQFEWQPNAPVQPEDLPSSLMVESLRSAGDRSAEPEPGGRGRLFILLGVLALVVVGAVLAITL